MKLKIGTKMISTFEMVAATVAGLSFFMLGHIKEMGSQFRKLTDPKEPIPEATRGIETSVAESGREAIDRWESMTEKTDLLLTDMVMPGGMSGPKPAETLVEKQPALNVIFTSGYNAKTAEQSSGLEEGINFLPKPVSADLISKTLKNVLSS